MFGWYMDEFDVLCCLVDRDQATAIRCELFNICDVCLVKIRGFDLDSKGFFEFPDCKRSFCICDPADCPLCKV